MSAQASLGAFDDLEGYAYRFPLWHRGTEDDCGAFLLYVRRRLPAIAARYEDQGKPFTAYLGACLRFQWLSYCRRAQRQRQQRESDAHIGRTLMATDAAPADPPWEARVIERESTRRRLVAAAVKACCELDDAQVAVLAESTGRADLQALVDRGRAAVDTSRAEKLRTRIGRGLAQRLTGAEGQHARAYRRAAAELRRVRTAPTNRQVAEILGLPKGTVDTWLYHLQRMPTGAGTKRARTPE
ncbi:MAG: hypothetical protein OXC31_11850 [Spirochaetaceae bacterium]|nr:hypothetical protein [Spirochaetaceae bacterium]